MAQGRTLWQIFTDWISGPVELRKFNPLKARIGAGVRIDLLDWREAQFTVETIRACSRRIGGRDFPYADYVLVDRPLHESERRVRLRINPASDPGVDHTALLLHLEDDRAYDAEFHAIVQADTGRFEIHHDDGPIEVFTRLYDLREPYQVEVAILQDDDKNRRLDADEIKTIKVESWDYGREVADEAGQPGTEYLFVEMDTDTGWFQIWRGGEVDPHRVIVM